MNQSEIPFLDKVEQRQAAIQVTARNLNHEPQIRNDHALARRLITLQGEARKINLFLRGQQG